MRTIVEQIFEHGRKHPDKLALLDGTNTMTYREVCQGILAVSDRLKKEYAMEKGDAVILAADKQLSFVTVYFACHLSGIIVLPMAPDTNDRRFRLIYDKVRPKLVIGFDKAAVNCRVAALSAFETLDKESGFTEMEPFSFPSPMDIADIIFTTGTTGEPKGVQLTQKNIAAAAGNINSFVENREEDVEMLALPISHSFGLGRMRCALSKGQTLVILGSFANMKRFFRFMEKYHVTGFGMVPASWAMIKKLSDIKIQEYAGQLRYIEIGSSPMPMEDKQLLIRILPDTRICMHYGLTEASRSCFIEFHKDAGHLDTVGKQSPNMHVEIRNEEGKNIPNGQEGEICVKWDAVTLGYYQMEEENKASFFGDYFRTGDWGIRDAQGYIRLISRKKELINVGGKKVSPAEVEEVLKDMPQIRDCVCVGMPDPEGILGEVVKAYVVLEDMKLDNGFEDISREVGKVLEGYKVPVAYEEIKEVPRTSSGKVQRLSLKKKTK